jgi:hypothetical protein
MVRLPRGEILICGGLGAGDKTLAECYMFVEAQPV